MSKVWTIAVREYLAAVRTKSFVLGLLLMPLLMGSGAIMGAINRRLEDTGELRFLVVDRTEGQGLFPVLQKAVELRNAGSIFDEKTKKQNEPVYVLEKVEPSGSEQGQKDEQRLALSKRVQSGEVRGFFEIGKDVYKHTGAFSLSTSTGMMPKTNVKDDLSLRYQTANPTDHSFSDWAHFVVASAVRAKRCADAGMSPTQVIGVLEPVPLQTKGLTKRNEKTGDIEDPTTQDRVVNFLLPPALMVFMFMMVLVGSTPLLQTVLEEKGQRIAEVLLGSVPPFQLMLGKLLGTIGVSLTMLTTYVAGATWFAHKFDYLQYVSFTIFAWFLLFQVLAILLYGSLFAAIGAACNEMKDAQNLLSPVMLLACMPLFFVKQIIEKPNGEFVAWLSFFPPATPMAMIARLSIPPGVPPWQSALAVVVLVLSTAACVYVSGRIFRVGLLMQGKGVRLSDLARWVVRG